MLTLLHRLEELADGRPEARVYTFLDGQGQESAVLTYAALRAQARSAAGGLGRWRGERVVLQLPFGPDFVTTFLGCWYAGCLPVPLALRASAGPIAEDCGAAAVLTEAVTGAAQGHCPNPDDLALLQYTSGSTSRPRGVRVLQRNLVHNTAMIAQAFGQPEGCRLVSWLPLTHDMGLIGVMLQALQLGGEAVLMAPETFLQEPFRWLEAVTRYRAHTTGAPNFGYELCLRKISPQQRRQLDLSPLRVAFNGAEPVRERTVRAFQETFAECGLAPHTVYPCYGLAEATLFVTGVGPQAPLRTSRGHGSPPSCSPIESGTRTRYVSCGTAWDSQRVWLEDGEVCVAGPSVAPGYWNEPDRPEGVLRTGDLGFLEDGCLYLTGRSKDLMILRGRNLAPEDVELTLQDAHPALRPGCCAVYSEDRHDEEQMVVACEVRPSSLSCEEAEIRRVVGEAVAAAHGVAPARIVLLEPGRLPKTTSGKIRRSACRELFQEDLRAFVRAQVQALSGQPALDESASFAALGLDSVARFSLTGELARHLGRDLPGDLTWTADSPEALVRALERRPLHFGLRADGQGPPLFIAHGIKRDPNWVEPIAAELSQSYTLCRLLCGGDLDPVPTVERLAAGLREVIVDRYPDGPFRFLGYSFGGKVAYEIARQLREEGREVAFLGILDGYPFHRHQIPKDELLGMALRELPRQALRRLASEGLGALTGGLAEARRWARRYFGDPAARSAQVEAEVEPFRIMIDLLYHFRPRPADLHVTLFRSSERNGLNALYRKHGGWGEVARAGVTVQDVPGDHFGMLRHPDFPSVVLGELKRNNPETSATTR